MVLCELQDFVPLMYRLDRKLQELAARQQAGEDVKAEVEARIEFLMPTYRNICINFADLHDTPVRMKAVGAIEVRSILYTIHFRVL